MRAEELEAAIDEALDEHPGDPTPFLVYADWLQSIGDPRGELIVFQHERKHAEASTLLEARAEHFLGPFATFVDSNQARRDRERVLDLEWELGFIHAAHIGWETYQRRRRDAVVAQLRELLELPSCRFLRHLKLGPVPAEGVMDFGFLLEALAEMRKPATLRSLFVGERGHWSMSDTATGPIDDVLAAFPRLRHLTLHGGRVAIGRIDHAELRAFGVQTGGLGRAALRDICEASWPKLERLEIWFGDPSYGGDCRLEDVAPLLGAVNLPSIKHLALMNCCFADELAAALPGTRILPRLATLDLSMGALGPRGARAMARARLAFAHLESLNVEDSALPESARSLVRGLAKRVVFGDKQDPERAEPEDPYHRGVSVGA